MEFSRDLMFMNFAGFPKIHENKIINSSKNLLHFFRSVNFPQSIKLITNSSDDEESLWSPGKLDNSRQGDHLLPKNKQQMVLKHGN